MTAAVQATGPCSVTGFGRDVIDAACRAPSIHNTQPWAWRVAGHSIELYADPARRLVHADPHGRTLAISCGAALHHAQVAARGHGWQPTVERWPDGHDSDLLARIVLTPGTRTAADVAQLRALYARQTDRRRFTSWPVRGDRLDRLAEVAQDWGAEAIALTDAVDRFRVEHLVSRAHAVQAADAALVEEHRRWIGADPEEGVPVELVPSGEGLLPSRRPRFSGGQLLDDTHRVATTDGVVLLCGTDDDRAAWVRTGEALGALWLHAVADGLAIVPLSQIIEVDVTRASLQHEVLLGLAVPHLLLRVGWQTISRDQLPRTPRRPLDAVLRPPIVTAEAKGPRGSGTAAVRRGAADS